MIELFGLFWIACWIGTIVISSKKGEGCLAVFTGFIFGPVALIFAIIGTGNKIKCPFCQELIDKKALICPHCRSELNKNRIPSYEEVKKMRKESELRDL